MFPDLLYDGIRDLAVDRSVGSVFVSVAYDPTVLDQMGTNRNRMLPIDLCYMSSNGDLEPYIQPLSLLGSVQEYYVGYDYDVLKNSVDYH
jgi:hypothetical protein